MSKHSIFKTIKDNLSHSGNTDEQEKKRFQAVKSRIAHHPEHSIPARAKGSKSQLQQRFIQRAIEAKAEVVCCKDTTEAINKIIEFLQHKEFELLRVDDSTDINELIWPENRVFKIEKGRAEITDNVSLTAAVCGIAETGTLMLASSATTPTTLAFLPEFHLVLLPVSKIVGSYEDAWKLMKQNHPAIFPRNVNLITGPSRSADIEQTLLMGAHGPKSLIIYLVGDLLFRAPLFKIESQD